MTQISNNFVICPISSVLITQLFFLCLAYFHGNSVKTDIHLKNNLIFKFSTPVVPSFCVRWAKPFNFMYCYSLAANHHSHFPALWWDHEAAEYCLPGCSDTSYWCRRTRRGSTEPQAQFTLCPARHHSVCRCLPAVHCLDSWSSSGQTPQKSIPHLGGAGSLLCSHALCPIDNELSAPSVFGVVLRQTRKGVTWASHHSSRNHPLPPLSNKIMSP